ncbi:phytanoyl-CoA dioxygenase family protein [Octadecabacter ascidiaceicola]|uniref:Phytanoyl-CoA dioxygenase (PhyH) n=1 Tax=Octadecabacter ascidiaceicola TaxID=1655543 RepID=A0A238KNT0_9RHOB|nr:phytanoyl-CoA dioxygenase family protein [Octadecabacter ascidiaceicola]SMX43676.1 Phytanoyl-CoA dioxygenase (PhyH) [Octadecabacter ascidiaceicola]
MTVPLSDRVWLRSALHEGAVEDLITAFGTQSTGQRVSGSLAGLTSVCTAITAEFAGYAPVRLVAFQKTQKKSWHVPWHQDRVIAVQEKHDVEGYTNWSFKGDQWHCEPPISVLSDMLFVRVFLDDCSAEVGGMMIARGSHALGKVASESAEKHAANFVHEIEEARAGDILILPMLTLHKSNAGQNPSTRSVLRVDFARTKLPMPLAWQHFG